MKKISIIMVLIISMCLSLTGCNGDAESKATEEEYTTEEYQYPVEDTEEGSASVSFVSVDLDGKEVTEAIFADKDVTILNVWATYCGPCLREMPELSTLADELPDNAQVAGIVIDVPEGDSDMIALAQEICDDNKISYTNIVMTESVYNLLNNVEAVPTTFILDSKGHSICQPIVGADVESYREAALAYLDQIQ